MGDLTGKVALVAGATRGAGRGIARALGERGATVWCTGRTSRSDPSRQRPETIEETAELVTQAGGRGLAVVVDHLDEPAVERLCARIREESGGLDVLVNDVWGGDRHLEFGVPFWKSDLTKARKMLENAIVTHLVTARHAIPRLLARPGSLLVEVTDGDSFHYRGMVAYDLAKLATIRLAFSFSRELKRHDVTCVAVTPGFLRSEEMLEHFGVTKETWREGVKVDPNFIASESPLFVGRAVAALAADPSKRSKDGRVHASWTLAREYGLFDEDGTRPDWAAHFERTYGKPIPPAADDAYAHWVGGPMDIAMPDWPVE